MGLINHGKVVAASAAWFGEELRAANKLTPEPAMEK
jgi:hypothetical protein